MVALEVLMLVPLFEAWAALYTIEPPRSVHCVPEVCCHDTNHRQETTLATPMRRPSASNTSAMTNLFPEIHRLRPKVQVSFDIRHV